MSAPILINNGKFNYKTFNGIPKYKQDALIAPYKNFLERYSGFGFGGTNYIVVRVFNARRLAPGVSTNYIVIRVFNAILFY